MEIARTNFFVGPGACSLDLTNSEHNRTQNYYALKINPGMDVFDDVLLQSNCDHGLVGSAVWNTISEDYIRYIWHEKNKILSIINLLFFPLYVG